MKKVLLTTTALVMLAGAASAELKFGGFAYLGVTSTGGVSAVSHGTRITAAASTETDGGISFGTSLRFATNGAGGSSVATTASIIERQKVFMSMNGLTLTIGGHHGAARQGGRLIGGSGFDDWGVAFISNDVPGLQADAGNNLVVSYAMGSVKLHVSTTAAVGGVTEFGVNGNVGDVSLGFGMAGGGSWIAKAGFSLGGANISLGTNNLNHIVLVGSSALGTGVVDFGYERAGTATNYFAGYSQSLGGGATASISLSSAAGVQAMGAGVMFNF
jgi:outer membrane protein OmpU